MRRQKHFYVFSLIITFLTKSQPSMGTKTIKKQSTDNSINIELNSEQL